MSFPALKFFVDGKDGRARATTLKMPHGPVQTPVFMPVGTKGTIKGIPSKAMEEPPISCQILLGNTYHLANRPGADVLREMGGLHKFMNYNGNILTDSGGFQMVSLLSLAEISEEGVKFQSPTDGTTLMMTPEESIRTQHKIGSDIIMVLDDVVHSCTPDFERFKEATARTVRWLDRCIAAHKAGGVEDAKLGIKSGPQHQNIYAIVQGGLDVSPGGLREQCLAEFTKRDHDLPGYAIGGLAGGEDKSDFWRVVDLCCRNLPEDKPRYLMGVGYPVDIVVCSALGVDQYDCVYPTRTARFGTAFTQNGLLKLKASKCARDMAPIDPDCVCYICKGSEVTGSKPYTRSSLHFMLKNGTGCENLVTHHNLVYMLTLVRDMREAILNREYAEFVRSFFRKQFQSNPVPEWCVDALKAAGIEL
mmetsp:Transcript_25766/g.31668  ORF Transcript_25766/g.31668 Transcript_25766/m.31668 type:complete len:419 (+) Transcript_25766:144-1400(+)|eukprot:CAMPEP_0204826588 /NCGR_PEP_ID=MMETSP1346-20131115/4247_1 /ASSEMBLY_ACC=CAM_ASM_000771 /TAXON_ID=215587 /ORGANISM="Aplanochytrium stocchinoi, Strain GSBS06" /LENGTH=418 /DNA_ID=CAMNT_0051954679 /DNA_START=58 /DNA_END=1314 /DNA_ORIENTATION=+